MKYPPYPKYKPSGVEWLGDVPGHWDVKRVKESARYWVSNVDKVAAEGEVPVRLCNYTDVYYHERIHPDMGLMETTATVEEIRRFGLRVGDVIITKDSEQWTDIAIPALVVETSPDLVCGYHLAIVRPEKQHLLGSFLLRAFQACAINQQFQLSATGVTRFGLPKSSIGAAMLPMPPLEEQRAIADSLDAETARLDMLVAKKRNLIEKLKEKRTALILRTVTRGLPPEGARAIGLDPKPKLKPSGIEWISEIPEHWEVLPLKRRASCFSGDAIHSEEIFPEKGEDAQIPVIGGNGVMAYSTRSNITKPVIAIGRVGALCGNIHLVSPPAWITDNALVLDCLPSAFHQGFLAALLASRSLNDLAAKTAQPLITGSQVRDERLPVPPVTEQRAIADYLDRERTKIDRMVAKVEVAIERLQEYRSALITAAVTGKIDVREAAAKL